MFNNHITISSVLNLDTSTFVHIVSTLESGLKGLDTGISTQVCRYGSFTTFVHIVSVRLPEASLLLYVAMKACIVPLYYLQSDLIDARVYISIR
jgi:hypothetical protein